MAYKGETSFIHHFIVSDFWDFQSSFFLFFTSLCLHFACFLSMSAIVLVSVFNVLHKFAENFEGFGLNDNRSTLK